MRKKEKNNEKTALIKKVRDYHLKRYQDIVNYLNEEDAVFQDIELLIEKEPSFYEEIRQIKKANKIAEEEKKFNDSVKINTLPQELLLEVARDEKKLVGEAITRASNENANTVEEIAQKENKINKLNKRLDTLHILEDKLSNIVRELQPEKRKVGRPKKEKNK